MVRLIAPLSYITLIAGLVLLPPQDALTEKPPAPTRGEPQFSKERLEQLVAPIALYPDSLLSQVLMAATYPLEVVEASRFMQAHSGLSGTGLEAALRDKDWDPAVKSLCGFPDLLQRM